MTVSAPSESILRRSARALYHPGRWPGRLFWPALRTMPGLLSVRAASREFERLAEPRVVILSVYRARNAEVLLRLLSSCRRPHVEIRLWALDEVASPLADWTVGSGKGLRCDLLNRLWASVPEGADWVVVADDDVELLNGWTVPATIGAMSRLAVDFAQPAHARASNSSHGFNLRRPLLAGRAVAAVEIGPLVLIKAPWSDHVLPFPEDAGMGFYLEWLWADLARQGCRSAVLDGVPMRHLGAVGSEYDPASAGARRHLQRSPATSLDDLNRFFPDYGRLLWPRPHWLRSPEERS